MEITKGEALIAGIEKIREGMEMISQADSKSELVTLLVGSGAAVRRMKDVMKSNSIFQNMITTMVHSRNTRLNQETVDKVITDFLDVLFDLSGPYKTKDEGSEE